MDDDSTRARAFRLVPIPELATDADLSGLFQLLDEFPNSAWHTPECAAVATDFVRACDCGFEYSSERSSPDRGACAAAGIHNCGVLLVPDRSDDNAGDGGAGSQPPFHCASPALCVTPARSVGDRLNFPATPSAPADRELAELVARADVTDAVLAESRDRLRGAFHRWSTAVAAELNR